MKPEPSAPAHAPADDADAIAAAATVPHLELKAALLLGLLALLLVATTVYLMYARGAFEATQRLVLVADDSEGVRIGMDLTFSGFPIGRVSRIELAPDTRARILVDVRRKDAPWLRTSSVFTLVRSLVGGATLKAYSGQLEDPPLPDGAERKVLVGDAAAELPRLVSDARELIQNLGRLSSSDSALAGTLADVKTLTGRLSGPQGAAGLLLGSGGEAKLRRTLDGVNGLIARLDRIAQQTDRQLLGKGGVVPASRESLQSLNVLLTDARGTLQKVDAVLVEAQGAAANARRATTDLDLLRTEVDATVRQVERLVDEVNRKWPFARDSELKLK